MAIELMTDKNIVFIPFPFSFAKENLEKIVCMNQSSFKNRFE